jgi:FMN phosphatase YigB (HAD superfamily)
MKYIFVDMDGVVAAYEHRGSVLLNNWFERGIFDNKEPVRPVIDKLRCFHDKGYHIHILSVAPCNYAIEEKQRWLAKHMPFVEDWLMNFVGDPKRKIQMLQELTKHKDPSNVYLIDDTHSILEEAEQAGFNAIHVSTFLARDI